jgi:hypothetical protein
MEVISSSERSVNLYRTTWHHSTDDATLRGYLLTFCFHWLYSPLVPWPLIFSVSWSFLQTVGLLGRVISSSQGLYPNAEQHKHRINTYTYQTSMLCVGFEPTIQASERAKTVHALDRSATVTDILIYMCCWQNWGVWFRVHRVRKIDIKGFNSKNSFMLSKYTFADM